MGAAAYDFAWEEADDKYQEIRKYLSTEGGYWLREDQWTMDAESFREAGIRVPEKDWILADFGTFRSEKLKQEMKYYYLWSMKGKWLTANSLFRNYGRAIKNIGGYLGELGIESFNGLEEELEPDGLSETEHGAYKKLYHSAASFITDFYDGRDEFEKDVWKAGRIPGARQSAAEKGAVHSLNFREIPEHYRGMAKRFLSRLVVRRSWSYCTEMLMYIKYFFRVFYRNGYGDGFLRVLGRRDMERYLCWVASDYAGKNATFRSKAVSYIRQFIDYIQLAEYEEAPEKDVNRLIFEDDIPRRERAGDTMSKIKYIPLPVREQLDASVQELEPARMRPVYILLRESGWRGTDVLNLRYDSCLDYLWNERGERIRPIFMRGDHQDRNPGAEDPDPERSRGHGEGTGGRGGKTQHGGKQP